MTKKKRAAYLELIKRGVEKLVAKGKADVIANVMQHTGYLCNLTSTTTAQVGAAIVGLAAVIPDADLRELLTGVVWQCEFAGVQIENDNRRPASKRWNRATALSEYAARDPEMLL